MAESVVEDVPPAGEAAASGADIAQNELPSFDEALLIRGKGGKVKRPAKPDTSERDVAIQRLKAEVQKHSDRIKAIKEAIESRRGNRGGSPEQQELLRRLQALKAEFQAVLRQKQAARDELTEVNKARESMRGALRSIKDKTKTTSLEQIDAKLREVHYKLTHETNTPSDEKKLHETMKALEQARPMAAEFGSLQQRLDDSERQRQAVSERLAACDASLNDIKAREEAARAALANLKDTSAVDIPSLHVEKTECWEIICACRDKISEISAAHEERYREYIKLDKNYNAWLRCEKRKEWEARQAARAEREATEAAASVGAGPAPAAALYEHEVLTCDQLATYLRKFLSADEAPAAAAKADAPAAASTSGSGSAAAELAGLKPFKKKEDDDLGFYAVGKKGKKGGAPAAAAGAGAKGRKLQHGVEALKPFLDLGIEVPSTSTDVSRCLAAVEAKKAHFLELRAQGKAPEPKAAAGAASSSAGAPAPTPAAAAPAKSKANGGGLHLADMDWPSMNGQPPAAAAAAAKEEVSPEPEPEAPAPAPAPAPAAAAAPTDDAGFEPAEAPAPAPAPAAPAVKAAAAPEPAAAAPAAPAARRASAEESSEMEEGEIRPERPPAGPSGEKAAAPAPAPAAKAVEAPAPAPAVKAAESPAPAAVPSGGADAKQLAACRKEGGKKGQDLAGVCDLGGVSYFNLAVDTAGGDLALLSAVMEGANTVVDEAAEERKGGAGHLGKMLFSAGDKQLAILGHVPLALAQAKGLTLQEWMTVVLAPVNGRVVSYGLETCAAVAEGDAAAGRFPLKMRDEAIAAGFALIRSKGLVPEEESSDDVNYAEAAGVEW